MKIVSGGQTGVDRAALDAALELGLQAGGWCPKGRRAEDGVLDPKYPLKETDSEDYAVRTEWNVRDSDGTLVITHGKPTGGTAYTIAMARVHNKPYLIIDLAETVKSQNRKIAKSGDRTAEVSNFRISEFPILQDWLKEHNIRTLNIAGPRESNCPGIHAEARVLLTRILVA